MKLNKGKKSILLGTVSLIFIAGSIFSLSGWFGKSGAGFSSTLLPEWKYRRPITLSGQTSNLTDYQVKVELPASLTSALVTAGKLQSVASNFADIRFTDANDNQLLNFWIETATTTATSTIWVKVPGLSASKSSTIYIYYGNPSASSASNGTNTFEFFDDFEDGAIGGQWSQLNAPVNGWGESGGEFYINMDPEEDWVNGKTNAPLLYQTAPSFNYIAQVKIRGTPTADYHSAGLYAYESTTYLTRLTHFYSTGEKMMNGRQNGATWTEGTQYSISANIVYLRVLRVGTDYTWEYSTDSVTWITTSPTWSGTTYNYLGISAHSWTVNVMTMYFDDVRVRKYASPEPTATVGSEQTQMTPVAHWRFDEGSGNIAYNSTKKAANIWTKRRAISISNSTSTAQTDYQVKVDLTTSNFDYPQVKTDGSDIRFVDADGTELNYWLETWNTSATSTFWVKIPSLPGNTTSTIYLYYGNPSASSASNGANTFEFFDDFMGANGASPDSSKWDITGSPNIQNNHLRVDAAEEGVQTKDTFSGDFIIETYVYYNSVYQGGGSGNPLRIEIISQTDTTDKWMDNFRPDANNYEIYTIINGVAVETDVYSRDIQSGESVKHTYKKSGTTLKAYFDDTTLVGDLAAQSDFSGVSFKIKQWTVHSNHIADIDYTRVRKYASTEPTVTAVGSQESGLETKLSNPPDAAWISGASWTTGKFNSGLKFDGIDDYVNFGDVDF